MFRTDTLTSSISISRDNNWNMCDDHREAVSRVARSTAVSLVLKIEIILPWFFFGSFPNHGWVWIALAIILINQIADTMCIRTRSWIRRIVVVGVTATFNALSALVIAASQIGISTLAGGDITSTAHLPHPSLRLIALFWIYALFVRFAATFIDWFLSRPAQPQHRTAMVI